MLRTSEIQRRLEQQRQEPKRKARINAAIQAEQRAHDRPLRRLARAEERIRQRERRERREAEAEWEAECRAERRAIEAVERAEELVAARQAGMKWTDISHAFGMNPGGAWQHVQRVFGNAKAVRPFVAATETVRAIPHTLVIVRRDEIDSELSVVGWRGGQFLVSQ